jgi:hypothetical protein
MNNGVCLTTNVKNSRKKRSHKDSSGNKNNILWTMAMKVHAAQIISDALLRMFLSSTLK